MNEARMWRNACVLDRSQRGEMYDHIKRELEQYRKDICELAEKHFFGEGKEVRKKMAIDYGKEWKKLNAKYGGSHIQAKEGSPKSTTTLGNIMSTQIRNAILDRERLMEEYIKQLLTTEIVQSKKEGHLVEIRFRKGPMYGKIYVRRTDFEKWLYKRKEVK